ncbi:WD40-repeat-containing domain protein [Hyaloraphidium curvatum]|nr:WD40-repeat-containing domain protein [Hyaloraphidium curvatum]
MAPAREKVSLDFPVFSMGFATKNRLIVGGGGGSSKSGVKNAVSMFKIDPATLKSEKSFEHVFPAGSDAVMSLSVHPKEKLVACGLNSNADAVASGHNKSLKVYKVGPEGLDLLRELPVSSAPTGDPYQKVTEWSPSGTHVLAACSDGSMAIYEYPSWTKVLLYQPSGSGSGDASQHHGVSEIHDGSWDPSGKFVATVSARKLLVHSANDGSVVQEIPPGEMNGKVPCEYRACRYGSHASAGYIFLFLITKDKTRSFVSKWKTADWTQVRAKAVARKPVTAAAVSYGGNLLAMAFSDLSISVIDADTLDIIHQFTHAHSFPITNLVFSRETSHNKRPMLCSSSADCTVGFASVPERRSGSLLSYVFLVLFLVALFIAAMAFLPGQDFQWLGDVAEKASAMVSNVRSSIQTFAAEPQPAAGKEEL